MDTHPCRKCTRSRGEWLRKSCALTRDANFPRDGHGQTSEQPFGHLPIFIGQTLRESLRRSLQQAHLERVTSLSSGRKVGFFFCFSSSASSAAWSAPCSSAETTPMLAIKLGARPLPQAGAAPHRQLVPLTEASLPRRRVLCAGASWEHHRWSLSSRCRSYHQAICL